MVVKPTMLLRAPKKQRWGGLALVLWVVTIMASTGCDCAGGNAGIAVVLKPTLVNPTPGAQLAARAPVEVKFSDDTDKEEVRMVEVFLIPQGSDKRTKVAELYKAPYQFKWNTHQVKDGFYKMLAVAYSSRGDDFSTRQVLVQVVNSPPDMWFVNCVDGQFVRGNYSVVVSVNETNLALKEPPTLLLDGQPGPKTPDTRPPYRFPLATQERKEGETVEVTVIGIDTRGNQKRIVCLPKVDNTPPTVRFTRPAQDGVLVGRTFDVEFDARDRFGIKEVRLWIDGSPCAQDPNASTQECKAEDHWIGKDGPNYPIKVELPQSYQTEQAILLTARAVDNAGNLSEPARLRVQIDPLSPEIFIRSPGQGEVIDDKVQFIARITDNQRIKKLEFRVEGGKTPVTLSTRPTDPNDNLGTELTFTFPVDNAVTRFGLGKRTFVVYAEDSSGNIVTSKREFRIGCGDSTDCPLGEVCHKSVCMVPAGLNQPCGPDIPCTIETECTPSTTPFCSPNKPSFCRKRCNPGNKYVQPQTCGSGFFCDKTNQVCIPADGCDPVTNQGCKSNEQCVLVDDDAGLCYPIGTVNDGDVCDESCNPQGNCRKGSWCVFILAAGRTSCMKVCDTKNPASCTQGFKCYPLRWSFGGGALNIGVCGPAQ